MGSGHCNFCNIWHSGGCCHPGRMVVANLEEQLRQAQAGLGSEKFFNWLATGEEVANFQAEIKQLRAKNSKLHRRCQQAEAAVAEKITENKGSLGRALANAGYNMVEDENKRLREARKRWKGVFRDLQKLLREGEKITVEDLALRFNELDPTP